MKKFKASLWVIALVAAVVFVWCANHNRLSAVHWDVPVEYGFEVHGGDSHFILGLIKAASEGDIPPFWSKIVRRLGAPYAANWNDYPMFDELLFFFFGMLARVFGLIKAANLAMLLGNVTSAVAFYWCCRLFRFRREWAWAGAILFAFTYFTSFRGFGHLTLGYVYTVPLALVCSWIVGGSRRIRWGDKFCWLCLIVSVLIGVSNPYTLYMFGQLLCLGILIQLATRRRKQNLLIGAVSLALAGAFFVVMNLDTLFYQLAHGWNPDPMHRHYYESELFALKIIELVTPPPNHHSGLLAAIGQRYATEARPQGEVFAPYLGLIGFIGIVWIAVEVFRLALNRRRRRISVHGLQALWILLYSTVGGLNCILALAGMTIFRCANRFSIFLSALGLLFLVSRLSVLSRRWQPQVRVLVAGLAVVVGLYDELPRGTTDSDVEGVARFVEADRDFTQKMETALPPGAMVFELPVMIFPEATPKHQLLAYELMRPYLFSKTLRFSYGDDKGRPRGNWQWELEKLPPQQIATTLEKYGFAAIYLNRRGFPDRGEALLKGLAAAGKTNLFEDALQEQVCVMLSPSSKPERPASESDVAITYARGWARVEQTPPDCRAWSSGNAQLSFYNPGKEYASFHFKCVVGALSPRRVSISMQGRELWSGQLNPNQGVPVELLVDAKPGNNLVELKTDEPPVVPGEIRTPVTFVLVNLKITKAATSR